MNTKTINLARMKPSGEATGFTLIELLVVIAVMAILAAMSMVVLGVIKKKEYISTATIELSLVENALEQYKSQYGFYPPTSATNFTVNTLYYELSGVMTYTNAGKIGYETLDHASFISANAYANLFSVGGPANCLRSGGDTESAKVQSFLPALRQNNIGNITNSDGGLSGILITAARGPDLAYRPLNAQDLNPIRYMYPGTNNPNSYDLWIQLVFSGKTNLVCNWTKQVIINSPLQ